MARIKNQKTVIARRFVAFPLMLLSLLILVALVYLLPSITLTANSAADVELQLLVEQYTAANTAYQSNVESIVYKRRAVTQQGLAQLQQELETLQSEFDAFVSQYHVYTLSITLLPKLKKQIQHTSALSQINQVLVAEEAVGIPFEQFSSCIKKIKYASTASVVLNALNGCKQHLGTALKEASSIPLESLATCDPSMTPQAILKVHERNNELLIQFYALSKAQKAKEAAAVDISYKNSLQDLQDLPSWNYCVNIYLQQTINELDF